MVECGCGHDAGEDKGVCRNCGLPKHVLTELHPAEPLKKKATKTQDGKTRLDLLPPDVLRGVSDVMAWGAKKPDRSEWDWLHGTEWNRYYGAALRHINKFGDGRDVDDESKLSHLDHAIASLMILSAYYKRHIGTDNLPYRRIARGESLDE